MQDRANISMQKIKAIANKIEKRVMSNNIGGPLSLSDCCEAKVKTSIADEGTGCYICAKCGKPCDILAGVTSPDDFGRKFNAAKQTMSAAEFQKLVAKGKTGKKKITPETAEKNAIKDWLNFNGWFWYPNTAGLGSKPGIPDLTAIKNGEVVQIEVKAASGRQSPKQIEFQGDWERSGGRYVCGGLDQVIGVCGSLQANKA